MKTVAVHDGRFHTDEVFAVAILRLLYPKITVVRTREEERLSLADLRVDVGRKYDPSSGDFDHHQKEFTEKRENGIPYASAGLVWKHFGRELVNSDEAFDSIDCRIIQPIDAIDSGVSICKDKLINAYDIGNITLSFYPNWQEFQDFDSAFEEVVLFTIDLLRREISFANTLKEAKAQISIALKENTCEGYIILNEQDSRNPLWMQIISEESDLLYVITQKNKRWNLDAVCVDPNGFERRKYFPESWRGLDAKNFAEVTGVPDAFFCHKARFCAAALSKEGAIALVEKALAA